MEGESSRSNLDGQDDANASFIEMPEHGVKKLSEEFAVMIKDLDKLPASFPKHCCIYKVSDHIRKSNEEAYTPQVISIGPFHRDNRKLQKMEDFKWRYVKSFTELAGIKLEDLVATIKSAEASVRVCYSDSISLDSDAFVKMIMLDAIFIIEFLRKTWSDKWSEDDNRILTPWLRIRVHLDLMLLENQLPFFIIEEIYHIAFASLSEYPPFIVLINFCQFQYYNIQNYRTYESQPQRTSEILHFTDLIRHFCLPPPERRPKRNSECIKLEMHSATQLAAVGLKFKMMSNCSPLELKYAHTQLEIPCFQLDKKTEIYARNLIAFEQCHYPEAAYITDYYFLLRLLIRSHRDVNFLVQEKIIVKWVDDIDATSVLNKILENVEGSLMNQDYYLIAEESNKFFAARLTYLQIMMATLKRDYFRTPWMGAATIGGILLLLLTVIQTVCALISVLTN